MRHVSPSHRIYARNRAGVDVQIGSAWCKTAKRGPRTGERFLTLTIDFPDCPRRSTLRRFATRRQANGSSHGAGAARARRTKP